MFNPKVLIVTAAVGFVLSFLAGIVSGVAFGYILLRACISAIVLGGLAAAISYISQRFLDVSGAALVQQDTVAPGSAVDITVTDEALPEETGAPEFYVSNPGEFNNNTQSAANTFKPSSLTNVAQSVAAKADVQPAAAASEKPQLRQEAAAAESKPADEPAGSESSVSLFDELPDMDNFISGSDSDSVSAAASTEASPNLIYESNRTVPGQHGDMQDSQVLAQALRTMMSRD